MTTFSKFMKQIKEKLVSECLMTDEIKAALASIEQPTKRKPSKYHMLMKTILHEMVDKYPDIEHKIRFKMAVQIASLIHKQNVCHELAWKIIIQRNIPNNEREKDNKMKTVISEEEVKKEKHIVHEASSSGIQQKKRKQQNSTKDDLSDNISTLEAPKSPPEELQMVDITPIIKTEDTPLPVSETNQTVVVLSDDDDDDDDTSNADIEITKLIKKDEHPQSLQVLREYVKNKVPTMHVNDRYKIVNKMKKLVNSVNDITSIENAYTQIVK